MGYAVGLRPLFKSSGKRVERMKLCWKVVLVMVLVDIIILQIMTIGSVIKLLKAAGMLW